MKTNNSSRLLIVIKQIAISLAFLLILPSSMYGAEMTITPTQNQDAELQKKDTDGCRQWAMVQTGYDPSKQPLPQVKMKSPGGDIARGTAGGALVGLGVGAIAGEAGVGAAIGAGVGAVTKGVQGKNQQQEQQAAYQNYQKKYQAEVDKFNKSFISCLAGRGYMVK